LSKQHASRPVVVNELGFLALHLDDGNFQGLMRKSRPHRLELGYTRTMMGFLLLNPQPGRIAMIGLGGGAMPKHGYRHLHESHITVVEINPEVIALREQFHIPADGERFRVVCADGADFVEKQKASLDVVVVDGFDTQGQVPQLCSQNFYDHCCASLSEDGVLVVNVLGADPDFELYLARVRQSFGDRVVVVPSEDCANKIIFAVKGPAINLPESELMARAASLESHHSLNFRPIAEQMLRFLDGR
jgi:spermidine synthase